MIDADLTELGNAIAIAFEFGMFVAFFSGAAGYFLAREIASVIRWQYRIHRFKRHVAVRRGIEAARNVAALLASPIPGWLRSDIDVPSTQPDPLDDGEGGMSFLRGVSTRDSSVRERDE
ncbi:hypothetical protein [Stenotrophobium rhamnosiphilum]|uniref:Uncharacterized protein n=1 Tax=Stenotrophobium rhamnosiphilum TaxID=2029166 RepID=A0A2T5MKF1_9GAMM|nr:hypothetical protein [Stenotrophobium rhamnosiphilum]PTU33038.1 hypothetical protein CJD38_02710 [Stenotrophobium rhamnosiphilum]